LRALRNRAAAAIIAAVALGAVAASSQAATIGGFGVQPLQRAGARGYFVFHLNGGAIHRARVRVVNNGDQPVTLWVYPVDGLTGVTSGVVYADRENVRAGAGTWLSSHAQRISLAPHSHRLVSFRVRVPAGAAPGDHVGGLAFQNVSPNTSAGKFQITEIVRAVVGVEIKVPGPATQSVQLGRIKLGMLPGTAMPAVTVAVTNTGALLCKPVLAVTISGPAGSRTATRALDTVLPGATIAYPFDWPHTLSPGHYGLHAAATGCGRAIATTGTAMLEGTLAHHVPVTTVTATPPSTPGGTGWWLFALAGAGGLALGGGGVMFGRRGRTPRTQS